MRLQNLAYDHDHPTCRLRPLGTPDRGLDELGLAWQTVSLAIGDPFPNLDQSTGIIIMGGPMSAFDTKNYPFFTPEMEFIRTVVDRGIPYLGICLGSQLLAQSYGAKVYHNPKGYEMGWIPLQESDEKSNDPIIGDLKVPDCFQLHGDTFDLPEGATNLLSSEMSSHQCLKINDRTYGFQFHPETNEVMLKSGMKEYQLDFPQERWDEVQQDLEQRVTKGRAFLKTVLKRLFSDRSE